MPPSLSRTHTQTAIARRNNDKSIYGTPVSPSFSSPDSSNTLTQSTSNISNSSTDSTLHETPSRPSRSRTRYPDLGRVPLHRRGTSKTYERLEDLLREAGYKETRVFTPEGERPDAPDHPKPEDRKSNTVREGVGAVVGFLAGLVGSRPPSVLRTATGDDPDNVTARYSPPPSPLEYRPHQNKNHSDSSYMASSIDTLHDPTPRPTRLLRPPSGNDITAGPRYDQYHQQEHIHHPRPAYRSPNPIPSYASERYLRKQLSNASFHRDTSATNLAQPRPPSRAGAYLRHMSSAPQIPRPSSTPAQRPSRKTILLNDSDTEDHNPHDDDEPPPLPRTWLETVARAVLFGASGSYVGGPSTVTSPQRQEPHDDTNRGRSQTLRNTRSSLSQASRRKRSNTRRSQRSEFADQTNTFLAPPLFMQLERGRSSRSIVEVSHTKVVCRSAPGSRATSAVRGEKGKQGRDGSGPRRRRRDDRDRERNRVPSLARTSAEGDIWGKTTKQRRDSRYGGGWGLERRYDDENEEAGEDDEDDRQCEASSSDDDAGVDLARILVPPKRQNSINSLRKHLVQPSDAQGSHLRRSASSRSVWAARESAGHAIRPLVEEDEWPAGDNGHRDRGWPRNFEDDEESLRGDLRWRGSGRSGTGKRRPGLPSHWGTGRS